MSQPILSELKQRVLTLTLNRPETLNSANDELLLQLTGAIRDAGQAPEVRVVVLTGAGRGFCTGADLGQMNGAAAPDRFSQHLQHTFNPLMLAIRQLPKPLITAVNGVAAGAGASIALGGDIRLWSAQASLVELFSNIGLVPDAGSTWLLPRLVGPQRAFELMALAEKVLPDEALRLGLCERVFPAERFHEDVQQYAERLAARPATALRLTKQALWEGQLGSFEEALLREARLQDQAGASWEHAEGVQAFKEKRAPDFLTQK
ncbi:enoyl-CoA hydratase/isomerase family protein [Deinococcus sonorensis]|uniref:Enoyl-CoA hydratase-related protein n=2 Tax=Deinococcus sonorensis TaxID=309891 RepID=A0AAU7UE23_9DEIO